MRALLAVMVWCAVGACGAESSSSDAATPPGVTFAVLGDTQHGSPDRHRAVVRQILAADPDFVLHAGDLVASGTAPEDWEYFVALEGQLLATRPYYPVLGNHEIWGAGGFFLQLFDWPPPFTGATPWFAFERDGVLVIGLDSNPTYAWDAPQYVWLRDQLATHAARDVFIVQHHPVFATHFRALTDAFAADFHPLFREARVRALFAGHAHLYARSDVDGIAYVVTGGGGGAANVPPLIERAPEEVMWADEGHFVLVTVRADRLVMKAITDRGALLDRVRLR